MHDMGYKEDYDGGIKSSISKEMRYPSIILYNNVPDVLMKKDVGEKCRLVIDVVLTEKGIEESNKKKKNHVRLDIKSIGFDKNDDKSLEKRLSKLTY